MNILRVGEFVDTGIKSPLSIELKIKDFITDNRRYNLLSNYIGEYTKFNFEKKDRAENLISSVLYELVSYLVDLSNRENSISINFNNTESKVIFNLKTSILKESKEEIETLYQKLNREDISKYFLELLSNSDKELSIENDYGLFMIVNDYNANIASSFNTESLVLEMQIIIDSKEI